MHNICIVSSSTENLSLYAHAAMGVSKPLLMLILIQVAGSTEEGTKCNVSLANQSVNECAKSSYICQREYSEQAKLFTVVVTLLTVLLTLVVGGWFCTCFMMYRIRAGHGTRTSLPRLKEKSTRTILNRYERGRYQPGQSRTVGPSVKYVRYGPSYENIHKKCQNMEDNSEGIYEILDGKEEALEDGGVAYLDDHYDKLHFEN